MPVKPGKEANRASSGNSGHVEGIDNLEDLILASAGEGIYGLDAAGLTTFVNPAAVEMLGWPEEEIVGKPMHALLHHSHPDGSDYPPDECPIYAAFHDGKVHSVDDEVFWRRDGSAFPVEYTSTPIRDGGKLLGAVVVFRNLTEIKQSQEALRRALAEVEALKNRLEAENQYLLEEIESEYEFDEIVGESRAIKKVLEAVATVAPTPVSVMISGETGTGKELVARAVHKLSPRSEKPLIKVNCASVPKDLFESEFFGHVRGAFTGAVRSRAGRFELADEGTLFLDEVGEIPLEMQSKLLRVLQEGQFERVGEEKTRRVDVRVIAATNRDLKTEVESGRFRTDLYYRLNVFPIEVPPLRERREDAPLLAAHFLKRSARDLDRTVPQLDEVDVEALTCYDWPGNVRELRNVIERALIKARGGQPRLNLDETEHAAPAGLDRVLSEEEFKDLERMNIEKALDRCGGVIYGERGAARLLGVQPTTLASRMKKLGIDRERGNESD